MRELVVRSISGLLYVTLIVFSAYWSNLALLIVIFVFSGLALLEFQKLIHYKSPISFLVFGLLAYQFQRNQVPESLHHVLLSLTLLTSLYLTYCLIAKKKNSFGTLPKKWSQLFLPCRFRLFHISHNQINRLGK